MRTNRLTLLLTLMLFSSGAHAHGEELLLFLFGQALGLGVFVFAGLFLAGSIPARVVPFLLAFAACWLLLLVPTSYFPEAMRHAMWGNFIIGLFPPLVMGGIARLALGGKARFVGGEEDSE